MSHNSGAEAWLYHGNAQLVPLLSDTIKGRYFVQVSLERELMQKKSETFSTSTGLLWLIKDARVELLENENEGALTPTKYL